MDMTKNATLSYSLDLWKDWMGNNFGEIRKLWYPRESIGLTGGRVVNDDAWQDLEDSFESNVVQCVNGAVMSLTPGQRAALERHLELCTVVKVRDYEEQLAFAKDRVWRALLANGCAS